METPVIWDTHRHCNEQLYRQWYATCSFTKFLLKFYKSKSLQIAISYFLKNEITNCWIDTYVKNFISVQNTKLSLTALTKISSTQR